MVGLLSVIAFGVAAADSRGEEIVGFSQENQPKLQFPKSCERVRKFRLWMRVNVWMGETVRGKQERQVVGIGLNYRVCLADDSAVKYGEHEVVLLRAKCTSSVRTPRR